MATAPRFALAALALSTMGATTMQPGTAFDRTDAPAVLELRSSAFAEGARIPNRYTAAGEGMSPPLSWEGAPATTRSFVLLVEDPDAHGRTPYVHWLVYDIPAGTTELAEGIPTTPRIANVPGALQGENTAQHIGYTPPRPPRQDPPHAYHFELFALNAELKLPAGATREQVMAAASKHVVAKGQLVGTFGSAR